MSDKKNIDRLFQEKFKDFETAPSDAVWNRINESLPNKKKKRRAIPLWWQIGGVAAVIALLLTVGISVFNSDGSNNNNLPIVNTDKTDTKNNKANDNLNTSTNTKQDELKNETEGIKVAESESDSKSILDEENINTLKKGQNSTPLSASKKSDQKLTSTSNRFNDSENKSSNQKRNKLTTNSTKNNNTKVANAIKTDHSKSESSNQSELVKDSEIKSAIKKSVEENKTAVAKNTSSEKNESSNSEINNVANTEAENSIVEEAVKQSIKEAIAENTKSTEEIDEKEEDKQNRWSIEPNVAPVYFGSLGQGSPIDSQFNGNSKTSDISMSYGIAGSYKVSEKLKVRAGVNRVDLNYITSNIVTFTGTELFMRGENMHSSNIKYKEELQTISFMNAGKYNLISKPDITDAKIAGDIDQRFGFIEVPLEIEYKLVNKKFGLHVIGGFSTLFLNNNEIYADIDGTSTLIGEASNISDTSFSANFGLGLDYSVSKQWNINLEPTFKYQINTFTNTSGDFKPFFVGVYTGLSFKF